MVVESAVEAFKRGFQPVPVKYGSKAPMGSAWTQLKWDSEEQVRASFEGYPDKGAPNVGLVLGKPSGGLVDVDLDHPTALKLRDYFIPPSPMQSGRAGRPRSHRWFLIKGDTVPPTRQYKMPDGSMIIELRSTGSQTVIPPSTWYPRGWDGNTETTQKYRWEGSPWGGRKGPAEVDGRLLSIQVALTGLGGVLLDMWPKRGGRHEAYLALAGGLLRLGESIHPYWERNLPVLIAALADASHDEDGAEQRVSEVMATTLTRLREKGKATGFTRLAEIIGNDHAEQARRFAREIEALAGFVGHEPTRIGEVRHAAADEELVSTLPPVERNPLAERISTWAAVDLEPYLAGEVVMTEPSILTRTDGKSLFYPGRVNSLFGKSESAKTWIALWAGAQEMWKGERVMFIDFEDEPLTALNRLKLMGVGDDDLRHQFRYVRPEEPIAEMQRYAFGDRPTEKGKKSSSMFKSLLEEFDPTLVITDGMTMMYGLHGHNTNDATGTDVVTSWLKGLTRGGRTGVIVIDHTGKGGGPGASPIGAHHKVAMVQGTAIRADAVVRPLPGVKGEINLVVFKDRHGTVRGNSSKPGSSEQLAGKFVLDSTRPDMSVVTVLPPDPNEMVLAPTDAQEKKLREIAEAQAQQDKVLALFKGDESVYLTTAGVVSELGLERGVVYSVWDNLCATGEVVREGSTRWTKYRLRKEGEIA